MVFPIQDDNTLGDEIEERRITKQGVIREVEIGTVMDLSTARSVLKWLDEKIKTAEALGETEEQSS